LVDRKLSLDRIAQMWFANLKAFKDSK